MLKVVHKNTFDTFLALEETETALDPNIVLIDDPRWASTLEEFSKCAIFALDIETQGVEDWHPLYAFKGSIRLIQVGLPNGLVLIADLGGFEDDRQQRELLYKDFFSVLFERCFNRKVIILGINLKFDGVFLQVHYGIKLRQCRDLMIVSQVIWGGICTMPVGSTGERSMFGHGMKHIIKRLGLGDIDKTQQTSNFAWKISNDQLNYAATDVRVLFPAYERFKELIASQKNPKTGLGPGFAVLAECSAVSAFIDFETYGFPVDVELIKDYVSQYAKRLAEVLIPFEESFPDINWASGPQVLVALNTKYPELKLKSSSIDVLSGLTHLPEINALLSARSIKVVLTYLETLLPVAFSTREGHPVSVRGHFRQIAPEATGRSSCTASISRKSGKTGVQLQNPASKSPDKKLPHPRDVFRCPDTHRIILIDSAASHSRFCCVMANVKRLIEVYNDDLDNHSQLSVYVAKAGYEEYLRLKNSGLKVPDSLQKLIAAMPNGKPWTLDEFMTDKHSENPDTKKMVKSLRDACKMIYYSSLNVAGVKRIWEQLHAIGLTWATEEITKAIRESFYELYPELPIFIRENFKLVNSRRETFGDFEDIHGNNITEKYGFYSYTEGITGRRKYLRLEEKESFGKKVLQANYTKACASRWLLSEASVWKHFLGQVVYLIDDHPEWGAYSSSFAHDEGAWLCLKEYALEACIEIYKLMEQCFNRWLKIIPFDSGKPIYEDLIGRSWSELH